MLDLIDLQSVLHTINNYLKNKYEKNLLSTYYYTINVPN